MDLIALRRAYDEQVRRRPPGVVVDDGGVVSGVAPDWSGVTFSDLDGSTADAAIAAALARLGRDWEWKHYSHDAPADLPDRLVAAGFVAEPPETLLVADLADLDLDVVLPAGVRLRTVASAADAAALVAAHDAAFGGDHSAIGREVLRGLAQHPPTCAAVVALAGDEPVSGGRVEFGHGTDFAGIWGGGTAPSWRCRGLFRALVAHRAALARDAGFRYLHVDAVAASRPILTRLGFVELATTTPYRSPQ